MEYRRIAGTTLFAAVTLGLAAGCSSGGGGSTTGGTGPANSVNLTVDTAEVMARNVSSSLPGCTYVSGQTPAAASDPTALVLYKRTIDGILAERNSQSAVSARALGSGIQSRANPINNTTDGDCPDVPGSFTEIGTHDNGVDDVTYSFNQYCTIDTDGRTVVDGTLAVRSVGVPSPTGPIPQTLTLSSGGSGLQITETGSEGTFNHSAAISNLKFTFGNGDEDATQSNPDRVELTSLTISEGRENKTFSVSGVDVSTYTSGTSEVIEVVNITYTDPDLGGVSVSTTPLIIDEFGEVMGGSITATGADNTAMVLHNSSTVSNGFNLVLNDETLGVMDCSTFAVLGDS